MATPNELTLDQLLARLIELRHRAQVAWEAEQREDLGDDWEPGSDLWLSLEYGWPGNQVCWCAGFRVREDEATVWALHESGATPRAAIEAVIKTLS